MGYDQWDYQHITCWNFLPFVLRRLGSAPRWAVDIAFAVWGAGIAFLGHSIVKMAKIYHEPEYRK
jgi:hypothetical protein